MVTLMRIEVCTKIVGYGDDTPDQDVLGRTIEGLWNFGIEKSLSVESSELFCRNLEDKNAENNADNRGLACKVPEGSKDFTGHLCEESIMSGQLELMHKL